jgi:hypothetical protein
VPERSIMLLHPLAPDVRCPACGADLRFIRARVYGDLYECSRGPCKCRVMHYRNPATKTCGWALLYNYASLGMWVACGVPAAEKE